EEKDWTGALEFSKRLADEFPADEAADDVFESVGAGAVPVGAWLVVYEAYSELRRRYPQSPFAAAALLTLAEAQIETRRAGAARPSRASATPPVAPSTQCRPRTARRSRQTAAARSLVPPQAWWRPSSTTRRRSSTRSCSTSPSSRPTSRPPRGRAWRGSDDEGLRRTRPFRGPHVGRLAHRAARRADGATLPGRQRPRRPHSLRPAPAGDGPVRARERRGLQCGADHRHDGAGQQPRLCRLEVAPDATRLRLDP